MRSAVLSMILAWAVAGCSMGPAARVLVTFDSEPAVTAMATTFDVVVLDRDGRVADELHYTLVTADPGPDETALPFGLTLEPRDGNAGTTYGVEGRLFDMAGAPIATQRARGGYVEGEALELRLVFDLDCAGAICAENETCQNGVCVEPCVVPTPIGALGDRRSPPVSCPESPPCPDGEPLTCVPHGGGGQGVHSCMDGVHVIEHCAAACDDTTVAMCVPG